MENETRETVTDKQFLACDWRWNPDVSAPCGYGDAERWLVWGFNAEGEGPHLIAECDTPEAASAIVQAKEAAEVHERKCAELERTIEVLAERYGIPPETLADARVEAGKRIAARGAVSWTQDPYGVYRGTDAQGRHRIGLTMGKHAYSSQRWRYTAFPQDYFAPSEESKWDPNPRCRQRCETEECDSLEDARAVSLRKMAELDREFEANEIAARGIAREGGGE